MSKYTIILLLFTLCNLASNNAISAELTVTVKSKDGAALTNIAVLVYPEKQTAASANSVSLSAVMDQVNRQFVPHTLVVQKGTRVSFPNSDSVKHHVYSFSPAKVFELKLYSEIEVDPLLFETAGEVELGCNIHDWMLGYIYVADTPYFAQTDENGVIQLNVPEGKHKVQLWHPRLKDNDRDMMTEVELANNSSNITLTLNEDLWPSLGDYEKVEGFSDYD
ncbi:methylamine utilization protein [Alteromonas facilis]|uniref:methylamine utilization protein n=1 Tax=Alteromonas facilis TaxID=2048004 RepID=UPI000C2822E7|nr:methylamine utilization protein [Alteromonas facilis]